MTISNFPKRFRSLSITALLTVSGCTVFGSADDIQKTVSGTPRVTFDALRANDPQARIGAKEHPKILAANGGAYNSARLESLLAPIAGALVTHSNDPERAYDITVLNSPAVNAFALPGGYLYVTRGLLALANDASEVAAVLAHEISHVSSNHGIERSRQAKTTGIAEKVVSDVVTNEVAGARARASVERKLASFSQDQELQADSLGIRLLGRAGFDPFAASRFLESMERYGRWRRAESRSTPELSASHPSTPRRIELARRHARAISAPGKGNRERDRFLKGIDGMLFGDSESEGFTRGNTFVHPGLKVRFEVPAGFTLNNQAKAVLASGPGETALRFDAVTDKKGRSPAEYIKAGWVNGLRESTVRPVKINGFDGATAQALAGDWRFDVTVLQAEKRFYRFILAAPKQNLTVEDKARKIAGSFRKMTVRELAEIKPLRIKIITVQPGDSLAKLAGKMQGVAGKLALFRTLNALDPGERPEVGSKVKIVTSG